MAQVGTHQRQPQILGKHLPLTLARTMVNTLVEAEEEEAEEEEEEEEEEDHKMEVLEMTLK